MQFFLVIAYILLFTFIILGTKAFQGRLLTRRYLAGFFLLKVGAGFLYVYVVSNVLNSGDIFAYFRDSQIAFSALKEAPWIFFRLVLGPNDLAYVPASLLPYTDAMGFWFDQSNYTMVRINAIFHLFSFGYYNVHIVFIAFLSTMGVFNLYAFFKPSFSRDRSILLVYMIFTPSILFWFSGLHKEAVVIMALGFILNSYQHLMSQSYRWQWIAGLVFGSLLLMMVRLYVFAIFLPGMVALFLTYRYREVPKHYLFSAVYLLFLLSAVILHIGFPDLSPFKEMMIRQQHFLNNPGNSSFIIPELDGQLLKTILLLPVALFNTLFHPVPMDCFTASWLCFVAMVESYLILSALIYALFRIKWRRFRHDPLINYCLFSSLSILILIGMVVNNAGAMVRYKSIVLPFLITGIYLAARNASSVNADLMEVEAKT